MSGYETVRVAAEIVAQLLAEDSEPVVVCSMERHADNTIDLIFKTPTTEQLQAAVALADNEAPHA